VVNACVRRLKGQNRPDPQTGSTVEPESCLRKDCKLLFFDFVESNAGFLWLMSVSDQAGEKIDDEAVHATVAGMVDLANVPQLVVDRFNQRPLS
jgi:hypothetical protein